MNWDAPPDMLGDDRDDYERDGLSAWADAARRRWAYTRWLERLETEQPRSRARNKRQHSVKCAVHPAKGERLSEQARAWEAMQLRAAGLTEVPWDPEEACPRCNDDAPPPPSGVQLRWRPTPVSADEPPPPRKRPTLRLV